MHEELQAIEVKMEPIKLFCQGLDSSLFSVSWEQTLLMVTVARAVSKLGQNIKWQVGL